MLEQGSSSTLLERVRNFPWYQSLRLPGGLVTPGQFDTIAELARLPLPASLAGRRCLDVGTNDGFWAFEMERRGAAEVLAIDVSDPEQFDWPGDARYSQRAEFDRGRARLDNFDVAHEALGSHVERRDLTVYELTASAVGSFDFVFMGSLLLHLQDPIAALRAIRSVLEGELLSVDAISPPLTALHPLQPIARLEASPLPLWWVMNLRAYRRLFGAAGFETIETGKPFFVKHGPGYVTPPDRSRSPYRRLRHDTASKLGVLHAWVLGRPLKDL
jgi:tRNA (mo5U34)-methyltransferase